MKKKPDTVAEIEERIAALQEQKAAALGDVAAAEQEMADALFDGQNALATEARAKLQSAQRRDQEARTALSVAEQRLEKARSAEHQVELAELTKRRKHLINDRLAQAQRAEHCIATLETALKELQDTSIKLHTINRKMDPTVAEGGGRMLRLSMLRTLQVSAPTIFKMLNLSLTGTTSDKRTLAERLSA